VYKGWVEEVKGQWVHGEGKGTREGMEGAWGIQVRDKGQGTRGSWDVYVFMGRRWVWEGHGTMDKVGTRGTCMGSDGIIGEE